MNDLDVYRAYLALLVAVLDGACDERVAELLHRSDNPHSACEVAHHAAHTMVASIDEHDRAEMRADLLAELHDLASQA